MIQLTLQKFSTMTQVSFIVALTISLVLFFASSENLQAQDSNRVSGLERAEGWQVVQANCTECHSTQLITQNSGSRVVWESRIRWMQETQGLGDLSVEVEESILDYLAENYPQKESGRRPALPLELMPVNPYTPKID